MKKLCMMLVACLFLVTATTVEAKQIKDPVKRCDTRRFKCLKKCNDKDKCIIKCDDKWGVCIEKTKKCKVRHNKSKKKGYADKL
jgi:hypothetical protein